MRINQALVLVTLLSIVPGLVPNANAANALSCGGNTELRKAVVRAEIALKTSESDLQITSSDADDAARTNQRSIGILMASLTVASGGFFGEVTAGGLEGLIATSDAAGNLYASTTLLYPVIAIVANGLNIDATLQKNTAAGIALSSATEAKGNIDLAIAIVQKKRQDIDRDHSLLWNGITAGASQYNMMQLIAEHVEAELFLRKAKLETLKALCNRFNGTELSEYRAIPSPSNEAVSVAR